MIPCAMPSSDHHFRFDVDLAKHQREPFQQIHHDGVSWCIRVSRAARPVRIDPIDLPLVGAYRWHIRDRNRQRYVWAKKGGKWVYSLQDWLVRPPANQQVVHRNGDGFDCRRTNLKLHTQAQIAVAWEPRADSKTGVRGVQQLKSGRYRAYVRSNGIRHRTRSFDKIEDAIKAAHRLREKHHK